MVSTRLRCRLLSPWIVKPCSRVLRKLSGELTIIQNWDARASVRPDLRLRLDRPDLGGRSPGCGEAAASAGVSGVSSDTVEILFFGQQHGQVADLRDVAHLVAGHHPAQLQKGDLAAAGVGELAVPLIVAPAVEK